MMRTNEICRNGFDDVCISAIDGKGLNGNCAFINLGDGIEDENLTD